VVNVAVFCSLLDMISLGPGSAVGETGEKKKKENLGNGKGGCLFTPFFAIFPHSGAWSQARI